MDLNTVNISKLPADVRRTYKQLQVLHAEKKIQNRAKTDFLSFVKCMWPDFIEGSHHRLVAEKFNKLATGELKRLIINMPPRHTKSEFASFLLPAWMVGPSVSSIVVVWFGSYLSWGLDRKIIREMKHEEDLQCIILVAMHVICVVNQNGSSIMVNAH